MKSISALCLIYLFVLIVFASCRSAYTGQVISGEYYSDGKDYKYSLVLEADSTFLLEQQNLDVVTKCQGIWYQVSKDTVLLKCGREASSRFLSSGYMEDREKKIVLVNKNKIQIGKVFLKRRK